MIAIPFVHIQQGHWEHATIANAQYEGSGFGGTLVIMTLKASNGRTAQQSMAANLIRCHLGDVVPVWAVGTTTGTVAPTLGPGSTDMTDTNVC